MNWNIKELEAAVDGPWRELFDADGFAFKAGANRAWNPRRKDMDSEVAAYVRRSRPYQKDTREARNAYIEGWLWALENA